MSGDWMDVATVSDMIITTAPLCTPEELSELRIEGKIKLQVLQRRMQAHMRAITEELVLSNTIESLYRDNEKFGVF